MARRFWELILPFLIILLILVVLFWPSITRGLIPLPTHYMVSWYEPWKTQYSVNGVPILAHKPVVDDAFRHLYPLRVVASRMMRGGAVPLWNPYNGAGTPLLAIMHPGYFTPFGIFFVSPIRICVDALRDASDGHLGSCGLLVCQEAQHVEDGIGICPHNAASFRIFYRSA